MDKLTELKRRTFSRRDFLKVARAGVFTMAFGAELEALFGTNSFDFKNQLLKNLIDRNPSDESLKGAYTAFINSHISVAGGYKQGLGFAADNLLHYFYGRGNTRNITDQYSKIAEQESGTLGDYMSQEFSFGINARKNLIDNPGKIYSFALNIGFSSNEPLAAWRHSEILIEPRNRDLYLGLRRHTLITNLAIGDLQTVHEGHQNPRLNELLWILNEYGGVPFEIKRFMVTPLSPIRLYDKYYFSSNPNSFNAFGFTTLSVEVGTVFKVLDSLPGNSNLETYMGREAYNQLKQGTVKISGPSLNLLEQIGIADRFEIEASFDKVGQFPVDVIIRR